MIPKRTKLQFFLVLTYFSLIAGLILFVQQKYFFAGAQEREVLNGSQILTGNLSVTGS